MTLWYCEPHPNNAEWVYVCRYREHGVHSVTLRFIVTKEDNGPLIALRALGAFEVG